MRSTFLNNTILKTKFIHRITQNTKSVFQTRHQHRASSLYRFYLTSGKISTEIVLKLKLRSFLLSLALTTSWKGQLKISLVSFSVRLYTAVGSAKKLALNQLHKQCRSRIHLDTCCPKHGKLARSEITKGYEYEKGKYVTIEQEDLFQQPHCSYFFLSYIASPLCWNFIFSFTGVQSPIGLQRLREVHFEHSCLRIIIQSPCIVQDTVLK